MLVGRDALLAAGRAAAESAAAGHGRLLLLSGEAGIGKSTLAQAIADLAAANGATVRVGASWEKEALPPFTPWIDALRRPPHPASRALVERILGGDEAATDAASADRAQARLFADVADALHDLSDDQPQVIILEDLHWADQPSLELLAALAPRLRTMALLLIGTFRDDEMPRPNPLAGLGGAAERMPLAGLDSGAVADIVAEVTGRPRDEPAAADLQRRTGGNPLFVTELARLFDVGGEAVPAGVHDVLERRLARVSSHTDVALGAASVLGHEFDQLTLEALVGGDVAGALDEARAARLVELCDGHARWRFVHVLVQAVRYDSLATAERERLHRAAVEALRGWPGTTAAELAHHASRARFDRDDPTPAELHVAAGQEALARLAWTDATAAFERALAAVPDGDRGQAVRAEAWLGIGDARLRQDRPDVRDAFDQAAALAKSIGRPDLLARAALGYGIGLGAFEVRLLDHRQVEVLEEAAAVLADDDPLLPLVLARLSVAMAFLDSEARREALAARAVDLARATMQPVVLGHALAALCDARSGPEHVEERLEAAREIVALAQRASDLPLELLGRRHLVVALLEALDFAALDAEIIAYAASADALGDPAYRWYVSLWRSMRAWHHGRVGEADEHIADARRIGAAGGSLNSAVLSSVAELMTSMDRRDRAGAQAGMDQMIAAVPNLIGTYVWLTRALVSSVLGDLDAARSNLARVQVADIEALPRDSELMGALVQVATIAGHLEDATFGPWVRTKLEAFADVGAVEGIGAYLHGSPHRMLGVLAAIAGDRDAARGHVAAAARATAGGGALLEALTDLDGARALQRIGDVDEARSLAERARTAFERARLAPLAAEAAALYGSAGSSTPVAAPASAPESAVATLHRRGDTWAVTWRGTTVHVKHAKGIADLATLLERPGREVHVRELEGAAPPAAASTQTVLDDTAVQQYRQRLVDLEDDLDEADRHGDPERVARLAAERDALVDELTRAFGLAHRGRRLGGDPDERLRKAVSARIKASIDRLDGLDQGLGRHLRASVHTGFWCRYEPEGPVTWTIER